MTASDASLLTRKGEQTRENILESAMTLFAAKGYQATTMRDIAAQAGCSLGLTYRYFARKEELVLAFYDRCARDLENWATALPAGTVASRVEQAMRADLARVAPYRATFGALFGVALTPESEVAVLGEKIAGVRDRVWRVFLTVVEGATDAPKERQAKDLATLFYAIHLALVLFWLQDRSPDQKKTDELITLMHDLTARLRPVLRLPAVSRPLARLARIMEPMFGPIPNPSTE